MINYYNDHNKNNISSIKNMYEILIKNLFITYPEKLPNKSEIETNDNFNKWAKMILETKDYNVITYTLSNRIVAFLNFALIDNELWISEIQIDHNYHGKSVLKTLIIAFIKNNNYNNQKIYIHINQQNYHSQEVFKHIGFKEYKPSLYTISINKLKLWSNSNSN